MLEPVKNIQKEVYEMREQRRNLQNFRINLEKVSMEPLRRMKMEADRKEAASAIFGGMGVATKGHTDDDEDDS